MQQAPFGPLQGMPYKIEEIDRIQGGAADQFCPLMVIGIDPLVELYVGIIEQMRWYLGIAARKASIIVVWNDAVWIRGPRMLVESLGSQTLIGQFPGWGFLIVARPKRSKIFRHNEITEIVATAKNPITAVTRVAPFTHHKKF